MQLQSLLSILDSIAPTRLAEPWDNVGLLVGDPAQTVTRAMLAIDYTAAVADEAKRRQCDLILAYHPPLFKPLKRLPPDSLIVDAVRRNVAIYSPHTALDVADGGTNDVLADALGLTDRRPLRLKESQSRQHKLATFVPRDALDRVAQALFDAGAGVIGNYTCCSFRTEGTGTFFGQEGTHPTVGQSGQLEQAPEIKLETVVPLSRLEQVLAALRNSHPYEEPAFDLLTLAAEPSAQGLGRIGTRPPIDRRDLIEGLKQALGLSHLLIAGPTEGPITRAACCAGSCGDLLDDALRQNAQLYLTGEMRHHDALRAAEAGMTVICTLHSNSERAALTRLAARLAQAAPAVQFFLSHSDRDPFIVT